MKRPRWPLGPPADGWPPPGSWAPDDLLRKAKRAAAADAHTARGAAEKRQARVCVHCHEDVVPPPALEPVIAKLHRGALLSGGERQAFHNARLKAEAQARRAARAPEQLAARRAAWREQMRLTPLWVRAILRDERRTYGITADRANERMPPRADLEPLLRLYRHLETPAGCRYCGSIDGVSDDHVPALARVYRHGPEYFEARGIDLVIVPVCWRCNILLGSLDLDQVNERMAYLWCAGPPSEWTAQPPDWARKRLEAAGWCLQTWKRKAMK